MKALRILRESDRDAIQKLLNAEFGKMESVVSVNDLRAACNEPHAKRLMCGAKRVVVDSVSLSKSYKYRKEVGAAKITHDGKRWIFAAAYRVTCCPGGSVGGIDTQYPSMARDEIVNNILKAKNITFITTDRP